MIANPKLRAFRYDPYEKKLTEEFYDHKLMLDSRKASISQSVEAENFGLLLGTLGRQGNTNVLFNLQQRLNILEKKNIIILLSEIFPNKLKLFNDIDAFIQVFTIQSSEQQSKNRVVHVYLENGKLKYIYITMLHSLVP